MEKGLSFRKTVSQVALAAALFIIVTNLAQAGLMVLINAFWPEFTSSGWYAWVLTDVPMYLIAFPVFLLVLHFVPNCPKPDTPTTPMTPLWMLQLFCGGMAMMYLGNLVSMLINLGIGKLLGSDISSPLADVLGASGLLPSFLAMVLVAPIMEEIVFRFLLYKKLIRFGELPFVLLSGAIFSLYHGNLSQMLYAFLLGCLLAWVYCRTQKIYWSMVLHALINLAGGIVPTLLGGNETATMIFGVAVIVLLILGLIYWVKLRFRLTCVGGTHDLPDNPVAQAILNVGMILLIVCGLGMAAYVIYAYTLI